jgi:hypothetical protein
MSTFAFHVHQSAPLLGLLAGCVAAVFVLAVFRPLLVGMARAALLAVRPRLSREQRAARAHQRDARLLQRMINASSGPSQAAELRAIAARA